MNKPSYELPSNRSDRQLLNTGSQHKILNTGISTVMNVDREMEYKTKDELYQLSKV